MMTGRLVSLETRRIRGFRLFVGFSFFSLCALSARALTPTVVLNEGDSMTLAGNRSETLTGPDGTTFENVVSRYIVVKGDSTLTVAADGNDDRGLFCGLIVESGTLTLDLTALSDDTPFRFDDGLVAKGDGRLVVKGRDHIDLGGLWSSSGANFAAPADCPNISFVDASGNAYAEPAGLRLCHRFVEVSLPTAVPWTIAPATTAVVFFASSAILPTLKSGNRITLTNYDLWINTSTILTGDDTIVVPPGREFAIQPRTLQMPGSGDECYYDFYGPGYSEWAFNIELGGEGAVFNLRNHHAMKHTGTISGTGSFRRTATAEQSNQTLLEGSYTFVGPVSLETAANPLVVSRQAALGADGNPLTLAAGAIVRFGTETGTMSGAHGDVTGPASGTAASVTVGPDTTLSVGSISGLVDFVGSGVDSSTLVRTSLAAGESIVVRATDSLKQTVSADVAARSDVVSFVRTDSLNAYYRLNAAGETVDVTALGLPTDAEYRLVARNGESFSKIPSNVRLEIGNGVTASVAGEVGSDVRSTVRVDAGGTAQLNLIEPNWRAKLLCAFDPSEATTVTTEGARKEIPLVKSVVSTPTTDYRLTYQNSTTSTWPLYKSDGPGDLSYVSCDQSDGNTRLSVSPNVSAAFAIVVFGSQKGGGQAIFASPGSSSGAYSRGGIDPDWDTTGKIVRPTKDEPILATNGIPVWVDGESVDPLETGYSGGWQIVSLETTISPISGLGYRSSNSVNKDGVKIDNGVKYTSAGQNYGEILFFSEAPTTVERQAAERYLAQKWGITYKGPSVAPAPFLAYGKGTVRLETDVSLGGSFAGTLDLNGHALTVLDGSKPPDASVVPSGRLAWFDPNREETLVLRSGCVDEMYGVEGTRTTGEKYLNSASRSPKLVKTSRSGGPELNWLFYSPYARYGAVTSRSGDGNSLRFNEVDQSEASTVEKPLTCKTVFMVQDSSESGGTPFLEDRYGSKSFGRRFAARSEEKENPVALASAPVWVGNSVATMADGTTYLDGLAVDGARTGFNARPEIFAVTRASGLTIGYFADLFYQNDMTNLVSSGEIQGEIILFDRVLDSDEISSVDAYLAWKWLGEARAGSVCSSGMTLTGLGTVSGVKVGDLPQFASGFTGSATLTDANYAFALAKDGTLSGKIAATGATLSFPATCTATVSIAKGARAGEYVLIDAKAFGAGTTWNLVVTGDSGRVPSLLVRDGQLILKLAPHGLVILVK